MVPRAPGRLPAAGRRAPGAGRTLLRSVAFFDGAAAARPLVVLVSWLVLGALMAGAATLRTRSAARP